MESAWIARRALAELAKEHVMYYRFAATTEAFVK
jgi:hypothetical protein